ncbi:MAG: hypothetical protein AseanaTS_13190 [Candidatus Pelagadaptatus aseana]|uniref:hypothetical protein n=1 Tax=Candidatus Pelagadaptatus aseana TaxID=3120508 RepID=UPI0039B15A36
MAALVTNVFAIYAYATHHTPSTATATKAMVTTPFHTTKKAANQLTMNEYTFIDAEQDCLTKVRDGRAIDQRAALYVDSRSTISEPRFSRYRVYIKDSQQINDIYECYADLTDNRVTVGHIRSTLGS